MNKNNIEFISSLSFKEGLKYKVITIYYIHTFYSTQNNNKILPIYFLIIVFIIPNRKLHFDPDFLQPNDVQIKDNQHPPFNSGRHSTSNEYKPDFITYFPREEYDSSSSLTDDFYSHPGKSTRDKVDTKKELVENSYKSQSDDSSPIIIMGDLYGTTEKESDHLDLHLAMSENDNLVSNSSKSNNNETQTEETESLLRIQKEEQEQAQGEELTQNYFNSFSSFYPYSSSQEEEGPNTICNDSGLLQPNSSPSKSNQEIETPTDLIKPTSSSSSSEIQMPSSMLTFFYSSTIAPKKIPTTTLRTTSSQIEGNFYHHHSTNIKNYIEGDDDDDQEKIKQGTSSSSTSSSSEEFKDNEDVVDVDGDDDSLKDVVGVNSHQNQALVKRVSTSLAAAVGFVIVSILTVAIALLTNVNNFHLGDQQRNNIRKRKRTNNNNNNINLHHNHITSNYKPSQPQKAAFPLLFPSSSLFSNNNINHIKNNGTRIHFPTQLETFFHHLESASSLNDFNDNNFHMFKKDFK